MDRKFAVRLGTAVLAALFLNGYLSDHMLVFSILETLVYFSVLYIGCRFGTGGGATAGTIAGLVFTLQTGELAYIGIICAIGALAGFFRGLGRLGSAVAYLAGAGGLAAVYAWDLMGAFVPQITAAAAAFILIPSALVHEKDLFPVVRKKKREIELVQNRWLGLSESFQTLADYFDDRNVLARLNQAEMISDGGTAVLEWQSKYLESQQTICTQFMEMGRIIRDTADQMASVKNVTSSLEVPVRSGLKRRHVKSGKMLFLEYGNKRQEAYMTLCTSAGNYVSAREVADCLSHETGKRWRPAVDSRTVISKTPAELRFEEDTKYQLLYGISRATRNGEEFSGDTFSAKPLPGGRMLLCLSDGMGSGKRACQESGMTVELLEKLMEAGFGLEAAVNLINNTLLLGGKEQHPTTLDICVADLYEGTFEIAKFGAPISYIKRDKQIIRTGIMQIPLGILEEVPCETEKLEVRDGDLLVMMTDGALDGVEASDPEQWMCELLRGYRKYNVKELAAWLMGRVLPEDRKARDDMTILVAGLWEK